MANTRKSKAKKSPLKPWEYASAAPNYAMIAPDLLAHEKFKSLHAGSQILYITMLTEKATTDQRQNLYKALREYAVQGKVSNHEIKLFDPEGDLSEYDLERICNDPLTPLFVFPQNKVAKKYGMSAQHIHERLKPLVDLGFISIFCQGIGGHGEFRMQTIYRFSNKWKTGEDD